MEKILIGEVKDVDGVRITTAMKNDADWRDLKAQVEMDLDYKGSGSTSVRFYRRTQKWFDAQPEYAG